MDADSMLPVRRLLTFSLLMLYVGNAHTLDENTGTEVCSNTLTCRNFGRCDGSNSCVCMEGWTGRDCTQRVSCGSVSLDNVELPERYDQDFGSMVAYRCRHGYQFPDADSEDNIYDRTLFCNGTGHWGPDVIDCVALCPPIPTWHGYLADSLQRKALSTVRYDCYGFYPSYHEKAGKVMYVFRGGDIGEQETTCGSRGQWIPPLVDCIEVTQLEGRASTITTCLWSVVMAVHMSILSFWYF